MKRCARCIMPETAKGIVFSPRGTCQLCDDFKAYVPLGEGRLLKEIEPFRNSNAEFNCVVPVSGGRDSAYALYWAKKKLGLRPLALHNDNDFETEIADRNLEAMSRSLDVPLIRLRSRDGISRRIVAEKFIMNSRYGASLILDQTCEACKYGFESGAYNTARRYGIQLVIWGDSKDESTASYHRLVPEAHITPRTLDRLLSPELFSLMRYRYYFNRMKKEYGADSPKGLREIHLYDYIRWDQAVIVMTIQKELGWSVPENSATTWRVDCKLVPLVNYLTEKAFGVSKFEIGFSNMVRSGKMGRSEAIVSAEKARAGTDPAALRAFLLEMKISRSVIDRVI